MLRCGVEVSGRFEQFKLTIGSGSFSPSEDSGYFLSSMGRNVLTASNACSNTRWLSIPVMTTEVGRLSE
jgi:hypothetical protein